MTLVSSTELEVLETFRVPYMLDPSSSNGPDRVVSPTGAELLWATSGRSKSRAWYRVGEIPVFCALADEDEVQRELERSGRDWRPASAVVDEEGATAGTVWEAADGSALLPFDPDEAVRAILREEYVAGSVTEGVRALARATYYGVRPLMPRGVQMAVRRRFARIQERARFPAWPAETALHALYAFLLQLVERVHGSPLPWIAPWPSAYEWAVVLTHDVEREAGYRNVDCLRSIERRFGARSAWYFVPERDYRVELELLRSLSDEGFEVCLHGLRHDGRDLSEGTFDERLPSMRRYAREWGALGFRSPATQRDWDRIARLELEHDSSYSDVARYEAQSGGSCTWLPFFVGDVVELPITLPMDHTIFDLLQRDDAAVWLEKAAFVRERGGMALLLTHPDYMRDPHRLSEYERFVQTVASDGSAWLALPRDIASWWRRRRASSIEAEGGGWIVRGPVAEEARVVVGAPARP